MPRGDAPAAPATSFAVRFPSAIWLKTSNSTAAANVRDLHAPVRSSIITSGESGAFPVLRAIPIPPGNHFFYLPYANAEGRLCARIDRCVRIACLLHSRMASKKNDSREELGWLAKQERRRSHPM